MVIFHSYVDSLPEGNPVKMRAEVGVFALEPRCGNGRVSRPRDPLRQGISFAPASCRA